MTDTDPDEPAHRRWVIWLVPLAAIALAGGLVAVAVVGTADEVRLVIPDGAAVQVDGGTSPGVVEAEEAWDLGTNLVIENNDRRPHTLGPLVIAAGQTEELTLDEEDVLRWETTLHPRREITVVVQ